ncbi:MAG: bifunctional diguanylate cyclase/phosphodiesterase [Oscillospiraceae bacterium]|nr:bifunctional diguanylate cyclase/phosphodiesterase [Oscillospiraceae bacterium]
MLADIEKDTFSVIATDRAEHTYIRPLAERADHSFIAMTWADMINERDCIIVKEEKDWIYIKERNPLWYEDLRKSNVSSIIFLPLRYAGEILGYIWATNFETADTIRIKETLELTTFFISSKLSSHKMLEHLKKISYTDRLTSIPNRFACTDVITHLIRTRSAFSVVSADINGFKSINDSMGFEAGNAVLKEVAARWTKIAKENMSGNQDFIARMGGDEFAFVIKGDYSEEQIMRIISQYEEALNKRVNVDGQNIFVTASFGYSSYPEDANTTDSLFSEASAAMREVKRLNSSNHILHFTADMLRPTRSLVIENKLRTALENDGIFFHLQPQFDMEHRLYGFEALARMKDENGDFISPGEFIPVAEKAGLVDKVDTVVFRKSAVFVGSIIKNTGAEIVLSVNVSVRHLMKKDFPKEVHNILLESGMPAKFLELEITESIMIESADKALKCIDELRKMGINIAIDDFGTGYSSLSYLNKFPANLLKIDKSFIDKMNESDSSKQYVAAIISIGHIMGFKVISEGVEKDSQLQALKDIGCDLIQGYIWGKPMPAEQAEKLITDS